MLGWLWTLSTVYGLMNDQLLTKVTIKPLYTHSARSKTKLTHMNLETGPIYYCQALVPNHLVPNTPRPNPNPVPTPINPKGDWG